MEDFRLKKRFLIFIIVLAIGLPGFGEDFNPEFIRNVISTGQANHSIIQDKEGFIWITTYGGGLIHWDGKQMKSYVTGGPGTISSNICTALFEDSEGTLWIGTSSGLNKYDKIAGVFTLYKKG